MRKGQMEVIVIFGVLLVVVLVVLFAVQEGSILPNTVPQNIYNEQKAVAKTVGDRMRDALDYTLRDMMMHGGYLGDQGLGMVSYNDVAGADFLLTKVPFWVRCDQVTYPQMNQIETWMEHSIEKKMRDGMKSLEIEYGSLAEFDTEGITIDVDVQGMNEYEADKIVVKMNMDTMYREYPLPPDLEPYTVELKTKFGEIYSFGKEFSDASTEERFFDVFSITAIYFSNEQEGTHQELPTMGVMTNCGEVVFRSPVEINEYLLGIIEYVMSSTDFWTDMDDQGPDTPYYDEEKSFAIQHVGSRTYPELEVKPMLADDWVFDVFDFMLATNFDMPRNGPFTIPVCTEVYNHAYDFSYPLVLRVKDPYTGYSFNLAVEVSVHDRGDEVMEPGSCAASGMVPTECQDLNCQARIRVVDYQGNPLEEAWVIYGGCPVGQTDSEGFVEGAIKCGTHELNVYETGGVEFFTATVAAASLADYTVTLNPINDMTIHFREVEMIDTGYYMTGGDDDRRIDVTCGACARECRIETLTRRTCNIGPISREHVYSFFELGDTTYPVTNMDTTGMDPSCRDSTNCVFCQDNAAAAEGANDALRQQIYTACRQCMLDCPTTIVNSQQVGYIPSGYTYDVETTMYDPLVDYMMVGGFQNPFSLGAETTDVFINVPRRSDDRSTIFDMEFNDAERQCLTNAMSQCQVPTIAQETNGISSIIFYGSVPCSALRSFALECGRPESEFSQYFCECPQGSVWSAGCTQSCGSGDSQQPCTTCCNQDGMMQYLDTIEETCGVRIVVI